MRIKIIAGGKPINLILPSSLLLNRLGAHFAAQAIEEKMENEKQTALDEAQLNIIFREIRRYRKKHPDWTLLTVESADGDRVVIRL